MDLKYNFNRNGIKETINWYEKNYNCTNNRFNPFKEQVMMPK